MYCRNCGNKKNPGVKFCNKCGMELRAEKKEDKIYDQMAGLVRRLQNGDEAVFDELYEISGKMVYF